MDTEVNERLNCNENLEWCVYSWNETRFLINVKFFCGCLAQCSNGDQVTKMDLLTTNEGRSIDRRDLDTDRVSPQCM